MAAAMPFAAMITISRRLPLLFEAMAGSSSWQDPELLLMTSEKVQAAGKSAAAIGGAVAAGQQAIAGYATAQTGANMALLTRPPGSPAALQAFGKGSLDRLASLADTLGEIGSRTLATGLRPAHKSVTANAKRLATGKRRG